MDYVKIAKTLVEELYNEKVDKAFEPYIKHLETVANMCVGENAIVVAYLHDSVKDGILSIEIIKDIFGTNIALVVDAITRKNGEIYKDYIVRCSKNDLARCVKINDLLHNMCIDRLGLVDKNRLNLMDRYGKAYLYLIESMRK